MTGLYGGFHFTGVSDSCVGRKVLFFLCLSSVSGRGVGRGGGGALGTEGKGCRPAGKRGSISVFLFHIHFLDTFSSLGIAAFLRVSFCLCAGLPDGPVFL